MVYCDMGSLASWGVSCDTAQGRALARCDTALGRLDTAISACDTAGGQGNYMAAAPMTRHAPGRACASRMGQVRCTMHLTQF